MERGARGGEGCEEGQGGDSELINQARWLKPAIPALRKLEQESCFEFEASMCYT